jgi:hypothetical protein
MLSVFTPVSTLARIRTGMVVEAAVAVWVMAVDPFLVVSLVVQL